MTDTTRPPRTKAGRDLYGRLATQGRGRYNAEALEAILAIEAEVADSDAFREGYEIGRAEAAAPDAGLRHKWVQAKPGRSVDDWECACGAFGSHLWQGYALHLEDVLAAHRSSDPSPEPTLDCEYCGRLAPCGDCHGCGTCDEAFMSGARASRANAAEIGAAPAGPAVDDDLRERLYRALAHDRSEDTGDVWLHREDADLLAQLLAAGPAVEVDGIVAEMVGAQAVLEDAQRRMLKATDTLAGVARLTSSDPTGEPE